MGSFKGEWLEGGGLASGSSLVLSKGGWGVSTEECGWLRGRADCLALLSSTSQMFVFFPWALYYSPELSESASDFFEQTCRWLLQKRVWSFWIESHKVVLICFRGLFPPTYHAALPPDQFIWRTENDRVTLSECPGLKFTYLGQGDRERQGSVQEAYRRLQETRAPRVDVLEQVSHLGLLSLVTLLWVLCRLVVSKIVGLCCTPVRVAVMAVITGSCVGGEAPRSHMGCDWLGNGSFFFFSSFLMIFKYCFFRPLPWYFF